ncbi:MAG: hypothetical protein ABSG68_24270, partial [Thermoguttaceae bacterium]
TMPMIALNKVRRLRLQGRVSGFRVHWPNRPKIEDTDLARRRIWRARNAPVAVEHRISHYRLPDAYNVLLLHDGGPLSCRGLCQGAAGWDIVSRHRSRYAAFRAAERIARIAAAGDQTEGLGIRD